MRLRARVLFAAAALVLGAGAASSAEIRLMTGPQGGVWIPLGGQLKDMWEKAVPGLNVTSMPGAGIANVRGIEEGKTEVGFGNSISTVDGMLGNPPFNKPHKKVCNVASLYPQYFQVVVPANAGINSIKDLKGKSIATQPRALQPGLRVVRGQRRPLLRGLEQARRSALEDHVYRPLTWPTGADQRRLALALYSWISITNGRIHAAIIKGLSMKSATKAPAMAPKA